MLTLVPYLYFNNLYYKITMLMLSSVTSVRVNLFSEIFRGRPPGPPFLLGGIPYPPAPRAGGPHHGLSLGACTFEIRPCDFALQI